MRGRPIRALPAALALVLIPALVLFGTGAALSVSMPPWRDSLGNGTPAEKITGGYLLEQSAAEEDTLLIFGSSELRTEGISTHPANFFAGKRAGFQVDLIGRGSCQSLIHALQIAASGDSLRGKKVVLITSPQSYVAGGIAPDLFYANFSPGQYLELLGDPGLSPELKRDLSARVAELLAAYEETPDAAPVDPALRLLAETEAGEGSRTAAALLAPYYALSRYLEGLREMAAARPLLAEGEDCAAPDPLPPIDWEAEEEAALAEARAQSGNNAFGMEEGYYTTYIGARLERYRDRDAGLSYTESPEYGDLELLFRVCREKGIEPLFVHVPLHGRWSDYTGFSPERREEYYGKVRQIAAGYGIRTLDLTGWEYEEYFLCDTMHLGWKGWLAVDRALIEYYYSL